MIKPDPAPLERGAETPPALRRLSRSRYALVMLGILALLAVGIAILTDFGASVDEDRNAHMGEVFLRAYQGGNLFRSPGIEYFNGPVYFMAFTLTSRFFRILNPNWLLTDGLHLTNFLTFLVGVFFFYRIALRLLPQRVALFVAALFTTQPVLFGSAFILQKDIPLMAFFLASVEVGWTAAEAWRSGGQSPPGDGAGRDDAVGTVEEWRRLSRARRILIGTGGLLALLLLLDLWWIGGLRGAAQAVLGDIYSGRGPAMLVELFGRTAEDAAKTPLPAYLDKLDDVIGRGRVVASLLIVAGGLALWRRMLPVTFARTLGRWFRRWGMVILAGCVLGLTTSVRVVAPFAGVLVAGYWIGRSGRRAVPALVVYGAVAVVTTYLTWPVLWGNPIAALANRAAELFGSTGSDFADHLVLFRSEWYASSELPWEYLPTLFGLQLTIPAVILFLIGTPYSWWLTSRDRNRRWLVALIWLWFILPVVSGIFRVVPNYDSFRHVLFCLPPAFLIMGFAAWKLSDVVGSPALRTGLAVLALAPGVLGIVRLHPYEYIYFNELVGGVRGAEGKFDLDYGCTAFRKAMAVVNQAADTGALIAFEPWTSTAAPFARADLQLVEGAATGQEPDFGLACRRVVRQAFPDMETIYEVRADGALLAVVKERRDSP